MKKPVTPFPTIGYFGSKYFCDRGDETKKLLLNINGGQPTILTSPRRIGKTSLIYHVFSRLPSGTRGIYLDILPAEEMSDFLNELASGIIRNVSEKRGIGRKIWDFVKSLRTTITFDPLSGVPQVSFILRESEINSHIEAIFDFLEKQQEKYVIAIDEFQQILKFPEKNTEAWLRTLMQKLKNVTFIFAGSQQHLLNDMFTIPSRPFYNSTSLIKIGKIDHLTYKKFIEKQFSAAGKTLGVNVGDNILKWADYHTYYVQLLCNRTFLTEVKNVEEATWKEEAEKLLKEHEPVFFNYRNMLTHHQWDLMKAVALEGNIYEPTGMSFIIKYALGNPSTVLRSLEALIRMELVYYDFDDKGGKYYAINDLLFRRWMEGHTS